MKYIRQALLVLAVALLAFTAGIKYQQHTAARAAAMVEKEVKFLRECSDWNTERTALGLSTFDCNDDWRQSEHYPKPYQFKQ